MTPKQLKFVKGLLYREGLLPNEKELVLRYTEGRTDDISKMSYSETQALIGYLGATTNDERARMVRKILSMAHEMRWELPDGKVDMERINNWMVKYTPFHVALDDINDDDLPKVVTIFNRVYMSFLKGL